jgi:hypothetical protein
MMRWTIRRVPCCRRAGVARESHRSGAAAWPAALAWERTGAGRCRRAVTPPPSPARPLAVTHLQWPRLQERPGRPPAPGDPVAAKAHCQGRSPAVASLRFAPGRPLTASFPGKIRHLPGGHGPTPTCVVADRGRPGSCAYEDEEEVQNRPDMWASAPSSRPCFRPSLRSPEGGASRQPGEIW